jgi:hypothetical protein
MDLAIALPAQRDAALALVDLDGFGRLDDGFGCRAGLLGVGARLVAPPPADAVVGPPPADAAVGPLPADAVVGLPPADVAVGLRP